MEDLIQFHNKTLSIVPPYYNITTSFKHVTIILGIILYIFILKFLPSLIPKGGKKIDTITKYWNLFLWILSVIMFFGITIPLVQKIQKYGFFDILCDIPNTLYLSEPMSFYILLFSWSKYMELFDTVILIVRHPEKPVNLLHWWHHLTVLIYGWYGIIFHQSSGPYFCSLNAFVHSFMYYYYYRAACGKTPSWGILLTLLQIVQMVIGTVINIFWMKSWFEGTGCSNKFVSSELAIATTFLIYVSYLILFCQFFQDKYMSKKEGKKDIKKTIFLNFLN